MKSTKNQAGEWLQAEVTSTIHQTSPSEYVYESSYSLQVPQSFRHYLMDSFPLAPWSGKNSKVKASLVAPSNTAQLSKTQPLKGCMGASLTWLLQPGSCYLHKVSLDTLVILKILTFWNTKLMKKKFLSYSFSLAILFHLVLYDSL